jgi:hypothetical protein
VAGEIRKAAQAGLTCGEIALALGGPLAATAAATVCGAAELKGIPLEENVTRLANAIFGAIK